MRIITKPINCMFAVASILNDLSIVGFFKAETALLEVICDGIPNQALDEFKDEMINS